MLVLILLMKVTDEIAKAHSPNGYIEHVLGYSSGVLCTVNEKQTMAEGKFYRRIAMSDVALQLSAPGSVVAVCPPGRLLRASRRQRYRSVSRAAELLVAFVGARTIGTHRPPRRQN